ncbi:MAG: type II toxin-antitoxin system death-on-curing family toxin [Pseudonocardiaceae bacterium]|nr:type II toxin-antitoxin system death-on-curing family toxin [Pseudonocardiaceae bacterium]
MVWDIGAIGPSLNFCLDIESVIEINYRYTDNGGVFLKDGRASLEAALARPLASFDGIEFYPSPIEKAAVLLHGVANSHAFRDGNKRTGWLCCVTYLAQHSLFLIESADNYADDFVVDVVVGKIRHEEAVDWLLFRIDD